MPATLSASSRRAVLRWFDAHRRDLPWRSTRDPWAVLVAEAMLQQTQVARVVPRYEAFLDRFPDPASCARAAVGEVLQLWAGLGYNRRAVNLHRLATEVCGAGDGTLPDDLPALLALPGVGPYTARAVLAFAFERDVGVLDTNVGRILARHAGEQLGRADAQAAADASVPAGRGWAWNQAMLDLGATVCTSREPGCTRCPLRATCSWHAGGPAAPDPATGSAGVSVGQSTFAGSDRQGRGRIVAALRERGRLSRAEVAAVAGWSGEPDRAVRVADGLVRDGLAVAAGAGLALP